MLLDVFDLFVLIVCCLAENSDYLDIEDGRCVAGSLVVSDGLRAEVFL